MMGAFFQPTTQHCPVRFLHVGLHPISLGHGLSQDL